MDENAVYYIAEFPLGEIQILTSNNRILAIKNDTIRELPYTGKVQKYLRDKSEKSTFDIGYLITRRNNGDMVLNSQQRTCLIENETGQIKDLMENNGYQSDAYVILVKDEEPAYFLKNKLGVVIEMAVSHQIDLQVVKGDIIKNVSVNLDVEKRLDWRTKVCSIDGITFLALHNKLIRVDENLNIKITPFPSAITCIYTHKKHGLWIGTVSNGVYHYSDFSTGSFTHGLSGLTVSSVLVDEEGGTWCTTTEKGVYYSANYNITHYPEVKVLNKKTTFMKAVAGSLFLSTEIDQITYSENNQFKSVELLTTGNTEITDVCQFKNQIYIATKGYSGILNNTNTVEKYIMVASKREVSMTTYQLDSSENYLYALGVGAVYKINDLYLTPVGPLLASKGRCMKVLNDTVIYAGCNDGLYKINTIENSLTKIENINSPVTKIIRTADHSIYATTKGSGLFRLLNDKAISIPLDGGVEILNDIIEDKNGVLWISSNDGLISLKSDNGKFVSKKYNTSNGLVSNIVGHLAILDEYLYLSSPDGICRFPVETDLVNESPPRIYLNQITINDTVLWQQNGELELAYWENSIAFTFDQINFRQGKNECLLYQLKSRDTDFHKSYTNTIVFENLPADTYELVVYAMNSDGIRSENPLQIKFTILPPFWKTWWFVLLVVLVFSLIIFVSVKKYIDNIRKKEDEKNKISKLISESQLSALQAQMNPHFIFNAINSIQNYILGKKEEQAYNYLVKFSKLVRLVLNNSREKELTLHAELEMLGLYIELEQLRFDKSFEYILKVSDEISLFEVEIPAMLLQPYVENAIWHGLMNLNGERQGVLKIAIYPENSLLRIDIEDNGIGRVRSNEFKKGVLHHSVGMQLTESRIEMINKIWNTKEVKVNVVDLYDEQQNPSGTRVELFLPVFSL